MLEDKDTKGNPLTKCKLVSTVILSVTAKNEGSFGEMEFAGNVNKRVSADNNGVVGGEEEGQHP